MNITFLLGNGFDVDQGIASSYSSFYEWYCDKISDKDHINTFRKNIKDDVASDDPDKEKTWADFEIGIGKYTAHFSKEEVNDFLDCIEDGQENICKYLLEQEGNFNPDIYEEAAYSAFYQSIREFYAEVPDLEKPSILTILNNAKQENKEIKFLSFNYTSTLERIISKLPSEPFAKWNTYGTIYTYQINRDVLHVHGTTNDFPVLGVNDESQIVNKDLLETPQFKEMVCKADSVRALGKRWHQEAEEQISKSKFVCIMGMSLGDSDAKWWRKLGEWLRADKNRHLIIYWFEKEPPNGVSIRKELQYKEKAKNRLLSFSSFPDEENERLKNRIHVVINTKRFLKLQKTQQKPESKDEVALAAR